MKKLQVLLDGVIPEYATVHSAGADLRAHLEQDIVLLAGEYCLVPTNTYIVIPEGFEGQVRPRSGLAAKHAITILNAPGTIDADYRGEIKIPIINLGADSFTITHGLRIAQLVIAPYIQVEFVASRKEEFPPSNRGSGGFGSTGKI